MATLDTIDIEKCPNCGGSNWVDCIYVKPQPFEIEKTGIEELKYVICSCGLIFANKYIMDLKEYYSHIYRQNPENGKDGISEYNLERELERAQRLAPEILKRVKSVERMLDVGSSAGILLSKMGEYYDCLLLGVEPSDDYRRHSLTRGTPTVDTVEAVNGDFELVTIIHVLEHQTDPIGFLKKVMEKSTGARYVIEVPFFDPRVNHPILFTELTLKSILEKAGLFIWDKVLTQKYITVFAFEHRELV